MATNSLGLAIFFMGMLAGGTTANHHAQPEAPGVAAKAATAAPAGAAGHATYAQFGITVQEMNQPLAQALGLKEPQGALVSSVTRGSAAARAGLEPGDVILKAAGQSIVASRDLPALVDKAAPGDQMSLEIWRKRGKREVTARLGEMKEKATTHPSSAVWTMPDRLGLVARPLRPEERREAQITSGVMVQSVSGFAARAGVQPGDIVLEFNGLIVRSPEALRLMDGKSRGTAALLLQRGDLKMFVPVQVG
jgi:serine protease Do